MGGIPFNDAYRYMDWLLTVPLLLMELILVVKFDAKEAQQKSATLGAASALMILVGYPGELITEGPQLASRWMFWAASMTPFIWIVYTLLVGLKAATESEENPDVADLIRRPEDDRRLVVHLPLRVHHPHARCHRRWCRRRHPDRLLHL